MPHSAAAARAAAVCFGEAIAADDHLKSRVVGNKFEAVLRVSPAPSGVASPIIVHFSFGDFSPRLEKLRSRHLRVEITSPPDESNPNNPILCSISAMGGRDLDALAGRAIPGVVSAILGVTSDTSRLSYPRGRANDLREALLLAGLHKYAVDVTPTGICFFVVNTEGVLYASILAFDLKRSLEHWTSSCQPVGPNESLDKFVLEAPSVTPNMELEALCSIRFSTEYYQLVAAATSKEIDKKSDAMSSTLRRNWWPFRPSAKLQPVLTTVVDVESRHDIDEQNKVTDTTAYDPGLALQTSLPVAPFTTVAANLVVDQFLLDFEQALAGGSVDADRLVAFLGRTFGPVSLPPSTINATVPINNSPAEDITTTDGTVSPAPTLVNQQKAVRFWIAAYAHATEGSMVRAVGVLEAVKLALEWPVLRKAFVSTGGPFWLSWLHMALPGCPRSPGLPDEALLDAQLHRLLNVNETDTNPAGSLSATSTTRSVTATQTVSARPPQLDQGQPPPIPSSRNPQTFRPVVASSLLSSSPSPPPSSSPSSSPTPLLSPDAAGPLSPDAVGPSSIGGESLAERWALLEYRDELLETRTWRMGYLGGGQSARTTSIERAVAPSLASISQATVEEGTALPPVLWNSGEEPSWARFSDLDSAYASLAASLTQRRLHGIAHAPGNAPAPLTLSPRSPRATAADVLGNDESRSWRGGLGGGGHGISSRDVMESFDDMVVGEGDDVFPDTNAAQQQQQKQESSEHLVAALCGTASQNSPAPHQLGSDADCAVPIIPKLHLGAILGALPKLQKRAGSTYALSSRTGRNKGTSILVGSLLRVLALGHQEMDGEVNRSMHCGKALSFLDRWIGGGGSVSLREVFGDSADKNASQPNPPTNLHADETALSLTRMQDLACGIFTQLLDTRDERAEAASAEAAAVFLCTVRGRVCCRAETVDESISAVDALERLVAKNLLPFGDVCSSRRESRVPLPSNSSRGSSGVETQRFREGHNELLQISSSGSGGTAIGVRQIVNRCGAIASVEHKIQAVQQQRNSILATDEERRCWVQQLCCCALERSLYCLLLSNNVSEQLQRPHEAQEVGTVSVKSAELAPSTTDFAQWARACCKVLSPLHDLLRASTTATTAGLSTAFAQLHGPSVHSVLGLFDLLLARGTRRQDHTSALLREIVARADTVLAVVAVHFEWLLGLDHPGCPDTIATCGAAPLRPVPRPVVSEMRRVAVRFLRRLTEACAEGVASAPCSASRSCGSLLARRVLTGLHAEDMGVSLGRWLEARTVALTGDGPAHPAPSSTRSSTPSSLLLEDALATLVALYSDKRSLVAHRPVRLVATLVTLLGRLSLEASSEHDDVESGATAPEGCPPGSCRSLCRLCLRVLVSIAGSRGKGEANLFHSSGAVCFLVTALAASAEKGLASEAENTSTKPKTWPSSPTASRSFRLLSPVMRSLEPPQAFEVGDKVRGKWVLANGKERWFPGFIVAKCEENTYDVKYDDGDQEKGKGADELRPLKLNLAARPRPPSLDTTVSATLCSTRVPGDTQPTPPPVGSPQEPSSPGGACSEEDEDDDGMFITIDSTLSPQANDGSERLRSKSSLGINLNLVLSSAAAASDSSVLDPLAGFSSLTGFGLRGTLTDQEVEVGTTIPQLFRWLVADPCCHELVCLAALLLTLTPDGRQLERSATEPLVSFYSPSSGGNNTLHAFLLGDLLGVLHRHLSSDAATSIVPKLFTRCQVLGPQSTPWLIRLLCGSILETSAYAIDQMPGGSIGNGGTEEMVSHNLGQGSFGRVVSVACPGAAALGGPTRVAIKVCRGGVKRIFEEVAAMIFSNIRNDTTCLMTAPLSNDGSTRRLVSPRLLDFGFSSQRQEFWLVMEQCSCSLKDWRMKQGQASVGLVQCCLRLFRGVVTALCGLAERGIVHLDLKCDNILLRRDPAHEKTKDSAAGACIAARDPNSCEEPPLVCIGDFGEACVVDASSVTSGVRLQRARGTECIQSPEMLLVQSSAGSLDLAPVEASAPVAQAGPGPLLHHVSPERVGTAIKRRREYVSCVSDVWSVGCLLFELITGEFLYDVTPMEGGWSRLFLLLTRDDSDLFLDRKLSILRALPHAQEVLEPLLRSLLVRNPDDRPSAVDALHLVDAAIAAVGAADDIAGESRVNDKATLRESSLVGKQARAPVEDSSDVLPVSLGAALNHPAFGRDLVWHLEPSVLIVHHWPKQAERFPDHTVVLPHAWMDSSLAVADHLEDRLNTIAGCGCSSKVPPLRVLGVTHLLHIPSWDRMPSSVSSCSSITNEMSHRDIEVDGAGYCCALCNTPCDALPVKHQLEGDPLAPKNLEQSMAWINNALRVGGKILLAACCCCAEASPDGEKASLQAKQKTAEETNMACSALAVAFLMVRSQVPLHDALLEARRSHATLRLSSAAASKITSWWEFRGKGALKIKALPS